MNFIWALLVRNWVAARSDIRVILVRKVLQPAIYLFVFGHVMGRLIPTGGGYGNVMAPGIIAIAVMNAPFVTIGGYLLSGCYFRTLEEWLLAPVSLRTILLAMVVTGVCSSLADSMVVVGLAWMILGIQPQDFICLFLVTSVGSVLFSLIVLVAFLVPERPDKGQDAFSLLMMLMTFFGCTFYSLDMLDASVRWMALLLPTTYISEGLRAAYSVESPHLELPWVLGGLLLSVVALLPIVDYFFRRRLGHFTW